MIKFTILGEPCSMKNSRRIVNFGSRPASIKSKKALAYEESALLQIPHYAKQNLTCHIAITLRIFYASNRPDLDECLLLDLLQTKFKTEGNERVLVRNGVYENDRLIKEKHVFWGLDKRNPRAEIEIVPCQETLDLESCDDKRLRAWFAEDPRRRDNILGAVK